MQGGKVVMIQGYSFTFLVICPAIYEYKLTMKYVNEHVLSAGALSFTTVLFYIIKLSTAHHIMWWLASVAYY